MQRSRQSRGLRRSAAGPLRPVLALAIAAFAACGGAATGPVAPPPPIPFSPVDLSAPWPEASPSQVGMDPASVNASVASASSIGRFRSLLVVKNGRLVVEEYFGDRNRQSLHDVRSVTKSIIGTLAALAVEDGHIGSLDDPIEDYLSPAVADLDVEKSVITIRHLLTMTGGFQWHEVGGGPDYGIWIRSDDHVEALLDRPLVSPPGSGFTYNSAAVHLLGVVVEQAVGEPLEDYARRKLFDPIGIGSVAWEPLSRGYVNGGAGIDLTARDLARFGQLYLQEGISGSRRVLPEDWVASSTDPKFNWWSSYGPLDRYTYGYLWWVSESEPETAYLAWGYGGQFVYVVPALHLVIVATTEWRALSLEGGPVSLEQAVLRVVIEGMHRAAR